MRLILALGFILSVPVQGATLPVSAGSENAFIEQETFSLVNRFREANQLPSLLWDAEIARVARAHSRDMALGNADFGHEGFSDRVRHLRGEMPGLMGAGENVFMTDDSSDLAHEAVIHWLNSPPHLHNIRGNYNRTGIGMWVNAEGVVYFTQIFVRIESRPEETAARPWNRPLLCLRIGARP
jgi:uncharacterized protein YkwD